MTTAVNYPDHVNDVTRKKYYDFIQNFPMLIPHPEMSAEFARMLDKYPVTPYLDSRDSFIKWVHFIHNRYNVLQMKDEMSLHDALERYYLHYRPKPIQLLEELRLILLIILTKLKLKLLRLSFVACVSQKR